MAVEEIAGPEYVSYYLDVVYEQLPRPDTRDTSWKKLIEFKDSPKSADLLRGFNLTLEKASAVKDMDLLRTQVDDWVAALKRGAKDQRIELVEKSINTFVNSKSLIAGAIAFVGGVAGHSEAVEIAGGGIAALGQLAQIGVMISGSYRSRQNWLHGLELGYVQHVKDEFGST